MAKSEKDRTFEEMTRKAMVVLLKDAEVYLACEDHPQVPLRERFDEDCLECATCGWRITSRQARTLVNDMLVSVSALFDLLDEEIKQRESKLEMAA